MGREDGRPAIPGIKVSSRGGRVGLKNVGNTCFMNTGLQCLGHIEPLVKYFLSGDFKKELNVTNPLSCKGELAQTFADLLKALWTSEQKVYDPRTFRRTLKRVAPHLIEGDEQQDVQEFLAFCIDGLHEDLNRVKKPPPPASRKQAKVDENLKDKGKDYAAALAWVRHLERGQSMLVDLMQGQLRSSLTCSQCGHKSCSYDPFTYLSLPVTKTMSQVTECISKYTEKEELIGDERWHCDVCKTKVDATKKIDLWKLPQVLVLHLKRFEYDAATQQFEKTENRLGMKLTGIDLSSHCSSVQKAGATYNVACVANHQGDYGSGHYTATCRVGGGNSATWHNFSDSKVEAFSGRSVVSRESYVIFLVRQEKGASASSRKRPSSTPSAPAPLPKPQTLNNPAAWPFSGKAVAAVLNATGHVASPETPGAVKSAEDTTTASPLLKKQRTIDSFFCKRVGGA